MSAGEDLYVETGPVHVANNGNEIQKVISHQQDGERVSYSIRVPEARAAEFTPTMQLFLYGKIIEDERSKRGQTS